MFETRLEYSVKETEGVTLKSLEEVQTQLRDGLHIESKINTEESKLGIINLEGEFTVEQLEDKANEFVEYLRQFEGILDIDYELYCGRPLELVVIFQ